MTNDNTNSWHRESAERFQKTTVRHPPSNINELIGWAKQEGVAEAFALVAQTFGQTEAFTVLGNLGQELSHPESIVILSDWTDNPIVNALSKLHAAYQNSADIHTRHPPLSHNGNTHQTANMLRLQGADIAKRHFLLYLIITPLAGGCSDPEYLLRRKLRLWLVIQAIYRKANNKSPRDANIQKAAGYITKSVHDKNWTVVDALLDRTQQLLPPAAPYQYFSIALEQAAPEIAQHFPGLGPTRFLNAVLAISRGECSPLGTDVDEVVTHADLLNFDSGDKPPTQMTFAGKTYQELELAGDNTEADDDDDQPALLYEIESADTPEQQRLTGQSILIQTAELSHYLPWSLDKALPPEINALEVWVDKNLLSSEQGQRFGAAIVWLSIHLSRSLAFVMETKIAETPSVEWTLTPDFYSVQRRPPRRHNAWHPKNAAENSFIAPFIDVLSVRLPPQIQTTLCSAFETTGNKARDVHDLWHDIIQEKPDIWFNEQANKNFPRLSSGKLGSIQSQKTFGLTANHSLARLISAHPRSALPAACGYSNWDIAEVESGFALPLNTQTEDSEKNANLLGSLLVPLESLLVERIRNATETLKGSRSDDSIGYHNMLTRYTVMALYAATGSRYLSEPFESAAHFCSSPPSIFINDKSDGGLHGGRMVPLPDRAFSITEAYKEHLIHFADAVEPVRSDLALNIRALPKGQSTVLPLFFLLDSQAQWHPVTDRGLPGNALFEWPLPPNLFRHRYAQQLADAEVNAEVIDGWMGHAERGAATYGDTSPRCWNDDASNYRHAVNAIFDRLGFEIPSAAGPLPALQDPASTLSAYQEPSRFGQSGRAHKRRHSIKRAIEGAKTDLKFFIGNRSINELESEQIEQMASLMLSRENGLPHPQAAIRFSVMTKQIEVSENAEKGKIRKRMALIRNERSLTSDYCPTALSFLPALKKWSNQIKREIHKAQLSKSESLAIATVCLTIDKRLTYARLLEDVIQGKNYRLIQHKKVIFLEYSEHLDPDDLFAPVQRHQIDYKTASLLSHGLGVKTTIDLNKATPPKRLRPLAQLFQPNSPDQKTDTNTTTLSWLLSELRRVISQANLIQLPGVVAAALSERRPPTSLSIYDYLRLREGIRYQPPDQPQNVEPFTGIKPFLAPLWRKDPANNERFYQSAKTFFQGLREILESYTKPTTNQVSKDLETFCQENMTLVSPAVLLVGYWLAHRIRAGKGRKGTRHNPYAASSTHRYLSALTGAFQGLAFNIDLTELDEDAITNLCSDMLTLMRSKGTDVAYFALRLQEFFRWAGERGIVEPLWDDLDLGDSLRTVKPGLFTEHEYLQCLELIQNRPAAHPDHPLLISFVLLLAFRFGLRASEAVGLKRQDWCESGNLIWILVRNNEYRELKRPSSRRAIPLLFELTEAEKQLVSSVLGRYETFAAHNGRHAILGDVVNGKPNITPLRTVIPSAIAGVLKEVTGSPRMSLHDGRHTFYNRLAPILEGYETPATKRLNTNINSDSVRRVMLGASSTVSRRNTMALARAMGHSSPHTGIRSYDHLMTDWADALTPVSSSRVHRLHNAVNTADWTIQKPLPPASDQPLIWRNPPTPEYIVAALRLMALGYNVERIETQMRLEPGSVDLLDTLVERTNRKLRFKVLDAESEKPVWIYGDTKPRLLLKKINEGAWIRLIEQAKKFPIASDLIVDAELPRVTEASDLVGRNGHLLMANSAESQLIRLTLDMFHIPEGQYQIIARSNNPDATELMRNNGWTVSPSTNQQLDSHSADLKQSVYRGASSGGLIFTQAPAGCIRNRYELVLALIITSAAYCAHN